MATLRLEAEAHKDDLEHALARSTADTLGGGGGGGYTARPGRAHTAPMPQHVLGRPRVNTGDFRAARQSLGVVLHEMLLGRLPAFTGMPDTASSTPMSSGPSKPLLLLLLAAPHS